MGSMATVSRRVEASAGYARTVATLSPGFGGGRLLCSHAPSRRSYVGANFEGTRGRLLEAGRLVAAF
mgnify:CR=1 FL=1